MIAKKKSTAQPKLSQANALLITLIAELSALIERHKHAQLKTPMLMVPSYEVNARIIEYLALITKSLVAILAANTRKNK